MTQRTYNENQQNKITIYATLKEARQVAREYGEEYEAVKAADLYSKKALGYTVEHR